MKSEVDETQDKSATIINYIMEKMTDRNECFGMLVYFKVKEGTSAAVEQAFVAAKVKTNKEAGAITYHLNRDVSDQNRFIVYERWKNISCLSAHLQAPYIRKLRDILNAYIIGTPEIIILNPSDRVGS